MDGKWYRSTKQTRLQTIRKTRNSVFKAESRAERKVKAEKSKKTKRTHPYVTPATDKFTQGQKPGRCFNCGVKGHWTQECPDLKKSDKISIADNNKFEFGFSNPTDNALQLKSH